jgi:hypothetical protein
MLVVHILLNLQAVFPSFYQINPADEAGYIFGGRAVMNNISEHRPFLPFYYQGPLIDALTAATYAPLHTNPSWFVISEWASHFILLGLLWAGSYLIAREVRHLVHPAIVMGLLTISPVLPTLLQNMSDALYAAMSGFALWLFLRFLSTRSAWYVAGASAFLGLAALTRNDALVQIWVFSALVVGVVVQQAASRRAAVGAACRSAGVALLPFSVLVLGYLIGFGIVTGFWGTGTEYRAYFAFEQAEGFTYDPSWQGLIDGPLIARPLYGTPDENNYSVITAIERNPQAFERRLLALPAVFFVVLYFTYGEAFAILQFALGIVGVIALFKQRQIAIALALVLWPAYLLTYVVFFARGGYLLTVYFCLDVLVGVGLVTLVRLCQRAWPAWRAWSARDVAGVWVRTGGAVALVGIGLVARWPLQAPRLPVVGASGEEEASLYMYEHFDRSTLIAALLPAVPWTAKMTWQPLVWDMSSSDGPTAGRVGALNVANAEQLDQWIARTGVRAFYLDYLLERYQPEMYAAVESEIGHGLDVVFQAQDADAAKMQDLTSQGFAYDGTYRIVAVSPDHEHASVSGSALERSRVR